MLKRLLLSLLLLAALAGGWRPAVAGVHGGAEHAVAAAPRGPAHAHADASCAAPPAHCDQAADADDGHARDISRCVAMAAGCFAPLIDAGGLVVARSGEACDLRLWDRPAEHLTPIALAPDLRPPRLVL